MKKLAKIIAALILIAGMALAVTDAFGEYSTAQAVFNVLYFVLIMPISIVILQVEKWVFDYIDIDEEEQA